MTENAPAGLTFEPVYVEPQADAQPLPAMLTATAVPVPEYVEVKQPITFLGRVKRLVTGEDLPVSYARIGPDGSVVITDEKPEVPAPVPDEVGLPKGYAGVRPPAGWCTPGPTCVEPMLREAYLAELNDPAAEAARRDRMFTKDGSMFSTPGVVTLEDVAAGRETSRTLHWLVLSDSGLRELWLHSERRNAAVDTVVDKPQRDALAEQMQRAYTEARTCTVCGSESLNALQPHPLVKTGAEPVCSACTTVAYRLAVELNAGSLIDTPSGPKRREDAIAEVFDLNHTKELL